MNIGTIVNPNTKGQIVIPQKLREALGITIHTPLQLTQVGKSLVLHPIAGIVRAVDEENSYTQILKKTVGVWAGDDWPKTEKIRGKREIAASRKRKQTW